MKGMPKTVGLILLLLGCTSSAWAEGRLFYTPSQRASLEDARRHHVTTEATGEPTGSNPQALTFNGVVIRSDGRNTRWVNGQAQSGSSAAPHYEGRKLKPGQTALDGKIYDPQQIIRGAAQ